MPGSRIDQLLIGAGACLLIALGAIGWLFVQAGAPAGRVPDQELVGAAIALSTPGAPSPAAAPDSVRIVVDVEGAVQRPGVYDLAAGSRVGDAIDAAGGYDATVDAGAAAETLNLASLLQDGQKILVPRLAAGSDATGAEGTTDGGTGAAEGGGDATAGPINLNTATAAELEELPGIGPVTAEKIIAARREAPFSTLEELVERGVINRGQLEDIRDLATVS